jgi:nucleotide-binding universal stress UspA family protein
MTRFLLATDSVHTSAAACDYLQQRAGPEDEVVVVAVRESESERDAADAANVISVRLVEPDVEVVEREGDPVEEILACADEEEVEEVLLGPHGDPPGTERLGATAQRIVARADLPVIVVPLA